MAYVNWKKLKERVSITDILEHYELMPTLTETPSGYAGICPFCESNAFKVDTQKYAWFCFGECKAKSRKNGGNILDFVARKEDVELTKAASLIDSWFPEQKEEPAEELKEEETPEKTETVSVAPRKPAEGEEGKGDTVALPESQTPPTETPAAPVSSLTHNNPLPFALRGIDPCHAAVEGCGVSPPKAEEYGAGYFSGKGTMHNRIVFPFHNEEGSVLGYAGYSPADGSWKYPDPTKFNPGLEVFGIYRALHWTEQQHVKIALVSLFLDPLAALQEASTRPAMIPLAVVSPTLSDRQLDLLWKLLGEVSRVRLYAPEGDSHFVEILSPLLTRHFIQLVRY